MDEKRWVQCMVTAVLFWLAANVFHGDFFELLSLGFFIWGLVELWRKELTSLWHKLNGDEGAWTKAKESPIGELFTTEKEDVPAPEAETAGKDMNGGKEDEA